ncbi:hypothetical protein Tco_0804888 [Tanacetum coccineum]
MKSHILGADFRLISMERFSGRQLFLLKGVVENLHFLGFLRGDDDYFLLLISGEIRCRFATSGNFFCLNWSCGKKLCVLLGCDDPLTMLCCRRKWKDGDDDQFLFSMRGLPSPVSWLGSRTKRVIAAMSDSYRELWIANADLQQVPAIKSDFGGL